MNQLVCKMCGNEFTAKRSDTKYCSEKCKTRNETIQRQNKIIQQRKPILKKCLICGDNFEAHKRNPYQIYCSQPCLRQAMRQKAIERESFQEQIKQTKQRHKEKYKRINLDYKDEIRFGGNKKHVLERDEFRCTNCGKTKGLIVHHIDHSGSSENPNNDMSNLTTLCRSCHMRHHASGENNYLYKSFTKEQILEARKTSSSWVETARKLNVHPDILRKKRKQLGIY